MGGSHNKGSSILGSILGSPYSGKLPYGVLNYLLLSRAWSSSCDTHTTREASGKGCWGLGLRVSGVNSKP